MCVRVLYLLFLFLIIDLTRGFRTLLDLSLVIRSIQINRDLQLAYLLGVVAGGTPPSNYIVGGHFVTRLARSYGILANDSVLIGLERLEPIYMDVAYLDSIGIMTIVESPTYSPGETSNSQPSIDSQLGTEIEGLKIAFRGMERMLD